MSGRRKRLAIARLWHEGNSFSPDVVEAADFRGREWFAGDEVSAFYGGTATEIGAALAFLTERPDWRGTFLRCAAAPPAGPLGPGLFEAIRDEIVAGLVTGLADVSWDAVYLSLHGALLADGVDSPDAALLRAVREVIGDTPLAVSFDFHANLDPAVMRLVDLAVGYKTYPHTDMDGTAAKALRLLAATAAGEISPVGALAKVGAVLPSFNMRTADGPMAEVAEFARALAARDGLLDITPFGGFAYGDTAYAGASVMAFADGDGAAAREAAAAVAAEIVARHERFFLTLPGPAEGIARALAAPAGTVAVIDPADNPLSGGIGDTPALLRALLDAGARVPTVFAFFHDPELVATAHGRGVGAGIDCQMGGRKTGLYGPPVPVYARVERLTDGRFVNLGPMETNMRVELGRTAVLEVDGVRVIVGERCVSPNDPAYFDLHGIDLAATRLLCVKAKNHFRAAFAPLCAALVDIDTPGPACLDLSQLPFRHAPVSGRGGD